MSDKETLFTIEDFDNPFERQKLESLPNDILVELLVRHLKREIKAMEYIKECQEVWHKRGDYWENELVDGTKLLEILGDKENE